MNNTNSSLSKLSETGQTVANADDDIRGRNAKAKGRLGPWHSGWPVDRWSQRKVRFLRVEHGGFLGFGDTKSFIPVDAITRITKDDVFIDRSLEQVAAAPRYDPDLVSQLGFYGDLYGHYGIMPFWGLGYAYPGYPYYK